MVSQSATMRTLVVFALAALAVCRSSGAPRYHHDDPAFSLALPAGYHPGASGTDALGRPTLVLSDGNPAHDVRLVWGKEKDPRGAVVTFRQVQKLELRDATPVSIGEREGFAVVHYRRGDEHVVRSALASGEWMVKCDTAVLGVCESLALR
jgi:hypothetical protein